MPFSRRQMLASIGLLGVGVLSSPVVMATQSRWSKKPSVPTDFNAEEYFVELSEHGHGLVFGNPDAKAVVFMTFDTQCRWCVWQYQQFELYLDRVKFVWHPVAVLNPWSELQGAAILSAKDPQATFLKHEEHIQDPNFKGLDVRGMILPFEAREAVWTNTKIFRRSGAREVPFGVLRQPDGRYIAVAEQTGDSFAKLAGF